MKSMCSMKGRRLLAAVLLAALSLTGCGGGGAATPASTTISGVASKGPIKAGNVKVFAIRGGAEDRSAPLGQGVTDGNGNYTIDAGSYKGPVLMEVTGGSYTDEVTATPVTLKAPLRAVFANASTGRKTVAVTPLTELAFRKAKGVGPFTAATIDDANRKVADLYKLANIVSIEPVAGGDDDQKKYAAACGSFSQLVSDNKGTGETTDDALSRLLTQMGDEMEHGGGFSPDSIGKMNDAMTKFSGSDKNKTGSTIAPLAAPTSGLLKLASSGNATTIGALDVTVNFPAGVMVKADTATGEVTPGVVTISGGAAVGANKLASAKFTPGSPPQLHVILINTAGFGAGEFVTIKFDLAAGGSFPANKEAFSVAGLAAKDLDGIALGGVTAAPASVGAELK